MNAALPSRFYRWWCWLIGQRPAAAEPSAPPPVAPADEPVGEIIEFPSELAHPDPVGLADPDETLQAMLATVKRLTLAQVAPVAADPLRRERTLTALRALDQIPSLQSLARNFAATIHREDASIEEVVTAVERDPALCVRILRMANSVEVSPEERIEDINTAVQMLGLMRVRKTARALFTLRGADAVAPGFDWKHLWIHGLATAAIAEELQRLLNLPEDPHLHLAALMHDVGKIVLSTIEPETYRSVLIATWEGSNRLSALEETHFGLGHGEAGVVFARHCGLGAGVIGAIAHHAAPEQAGDHALPAALVSIANYVSKAYGLGFSGARLDEADGDFASQPGWSIIREHAPALRDLDEIEEDLRVFIARLKPELASMRDEQ